MKSASLNLIGIFGVTKSCFGDSCGAGEQCSSCYIQNLNSGRKKKRAELLEIHEMVQLSLYLIQLSSAHNPLLDSKKLTVGF